MRVLTPSPKSVPSGSTSPARPPGLSDFMRSTRNRSAVSRVRNSAGKLVSMPSSSMPPKGGLVTMTSTRSLGRPIAQRPGQRVVVADVGRHIDAVQQQIGHAQDMRQVFLLDAGETVLDEAFVGFGLGLLAQVLDGADLLVDRHPLHHVHRQVLRVVEQDRRVGQHDALDRRVRDVALVPERDVLEPGLGVAAQQPRQPGDRLAMIGLRLCGIADEPFCARRERLLDLADLGALQVADLEGEPLEPGAGDRERREQLGVAVARDDLRRDVLARAGRAAPDARLDRRRGRRVGPDRAGDLAHRGLLERALAAGRRLRSRLEGEAGQLERRTSSARRGRRACGRCRACRRARARARRALAVGASRRRPGSRPASRSCSASAVSSTSEEVSPKWIQRPASPTDAGTTSTNAATSWSVTARAP